MNSETLLRAAYDLGASNAYRDSPMVGFDPQAWAKFSAYVSEKVNSDKERDYWMERAYAAEDKLRKSYDDALLTVADLQRKLSERTDWMHGVLDNILAPLAMESNKLGMLADGYGQLSVKLLPLPNLPKEKPPGTNRGG